MTAEMLHFRVQALRRVAERGVATDGIRQILAGGDAVVAFPEEGERIVLGWAGGCPLHVQAADRPGATLVLSVYEPQARSWTGGFRWRAGG